jgi:hypothetical protein
MNQFDVMNGNYSQLVPNPAGCYNMTYFQTPNTTVMAWVRQLNNTDPNDAQVFVGSATSMMWAIGSGNTWSSHDKPVMGNTNIVLVNSTNDCVIEFGGGVTASFHFPTADTISFTVTLLGWRAWYVKSLKYCLTLFWGESNPLRILLQACDWIPKWVCPSNDWH